MNIYQKMLEVKKVVPYLQKAADGPQFKFNPSSQVLGALMEKTNEMGLFLEIEVKGHTVTTREKTNAKGGVTTEYFTELDLVYTWVNADNPEEKIIKTWYGQGIDTAGEKGVGKALTYAEKFFLLKWFNIATDKDDPDSFQEKVERTLPKEKQEPTATIKSKWEMVMGDMSKFNAQYTKWVNEKRSNEWIDQFLTEKLEEKMGATVHEESKGA